MTLSFVNQKGGVGKTTTCVTLASFLVARGSKVLIVDSDPQGNATVFTGARGEAGLDLYRALMGEHSPEACIAKTSQTGLFCLPSSMDLAGVDLDLASHADRFFRMRGLLAQIRSPFDFIFIDTPPSLGLLPVMALTGSDGCVVPMQAEYFSLEGLARVVQTIRHVQETANPKLTIFGILLNMVDSRTTLAKQVEEDLRSHFGDQVFRTIIPRLVRFAEAPGFEKPLYELDRLSQAGKIYEQFSEEFVERCRAFSGAEGVVC